MVSSSIRNRSDAHLGLRDGDSRHQQERGAKPCDSVAVIHPMSTSRSAGAAARQAISSERREGLSEPDA